MTISLGIKHVHRPASELADDPGFRFAFVRHPVDRFISAYRFTQIDDKNRRYSEMLGATAEQIIERIPSHMALLPQSHWIDAPVDFIGRYERLEDDWATVCRIIGHESELTHFNHTAENHLSRGVRLATAEEILTLRVIRFIEETYAEDFKKYGYTERYKQ